MAALVASLNKRYSVARTMVVTAAGGNLLKPGHRLGGSAIAAGEVYKPASASLFSCFADGAG